MRHFTSILGDFLDSVLNIDARIHEEYVEREALKGVSWAVALVKRQADAGDEGARAVFAQIQKGQS